MAQQFNLQSQKAIVGTKLGELLKDYSKWIWLSIFFFWLVFPLIILFIKFIQLIMAINDLKNIEPNTHLDQAFMMLLVGLILDLTGVGTVFSVIFMMLGFDALDQWVVEINRQTPSPHLQQASEGFNSAKIGSILILIFIGFFVLPGGCEKAGEGLIQYYGSPQVSTVYTQGYYQQPSAVPPPQYSARNVVQPPLEPKKSRYCSHCGAELPASHVKFCGNCGSESE